MQLWSLLRLCCSNTMIFFFFCQSDLDLLHTLNYCLFAWPSFDQDLAGRQMASHLHHTLAYRRVHGWLNDCKLSWSCGYKTAPNHHPSTTLCLRAFHNLAFVYICRDVLSWEDWQLCWMWKSRLTMEHSAPVCLGFLFFLTISKLIWSNNRDYLSSAKWCYFYLLGGNNALHLGLFVNTYHFLKATSTQRK